MEQKKCKGCGMSMDEPSDYGLSNIESIYCRYCVDEDGNYFEHGELLKAMTKKNVFSMGIDIDIAEKVARQNLENDKNGKTLADFGGINIFDMTM